MAIAPLTGFKAFTFDGEKSTDYGVAILGEGVFNAPERDVEMITIPGRSGQFVLDNGRFENIEVTYPANLIADSEADFAEALSDFRNMLCSKRGYVRLQDDYHPDEYRMAVYKSGLEVDEKVLRAGEFEITFDCKPQRWLVSGETAVAVTSGDTLTNPTLFESGPLLETAGHGTIGFNGYEIEFEGVPIGEVQIAEKTSGTMESTKTTMLDATGDFTFDTTLLNTGDPIYPEAREFEIRTTLSANYGRFSDEGFRTTPTNVLDAHGSAINKTTPKEYITHLIPDLGDGFVYGTAKTVHCSAEFRYQYGATGSSMNYWFETVDVTIAYDGADTYTVSVSSLSSLASAVTRSLTVGLTTPTIYGNSSEPNTDPIFIDCDLGEAYTNEGGVYRSLNQYIDLGSDLPKLGVGENEITFDNTITELKVTPRWWKI